MKAQDGLLVNLDFLQHQIALIDHKLDHIARALETCGDCLETDGLHQMRHAAMLERDILRILAIQYAPVRHVLALDALIIQLLAVSKRQQARFSHNWQRGRVTPTAYWEADLYCSFLTHLLAEYHAWQQGRPLYPPVPANSQSEQPHNR